MSSGNMKDYYLNKKYMTNEGYQVTIVEYNSSRDLTVQFENGYKVKSLLSNVKKGRISNPYHPSVCNKGYYGVGPYLSKINKVQTESYKVWNDMIRRCYPITDKDKEKFKAYEGCYVCDEWLNYQNFAKWYELNIYHIDGEVMQLEKDILIKGNKCYSPDTCTFVPRPINNLLIKSNSIRGDLPIGVTLSKKTKKPYRLLCIVNGKQKLLGTFDNINEAFNAYKEFKENYIKEKANEYKDKIPDKVYQALINYKVEIDD